jgi:murein DD-endopeptidase MepM/ murein hydrolase activator NlpD
MWAGLVAVIVSLAGMATLASGPLTRPATAGVATAGIAGTASQHFKPGTLPTAASSPLAAAAGVRVEADDRYEDLLLEVRSGDTLDKLFREYDLHLGDLSLLLENATARHYLQTLRPGDRIAVRHEAGRIFDLEREIDITKALQVVRAADGLTYVADVRRLPLERRQNEVAGRINRSLFEAASDAAVSEQLILKLAEMFAWDIDFVRDVGAGDSFTVIYDELWRDGRKLAEGDIVAAEFINRGSRYTAVRFDSGDGSTDYYSADGQPLRKAFLRVPVSFTRISSNFNPSRRHPILNSIRAHRGVDYAAPRGTPVKAAGDGKIIFRGWKSGYGNTVILQHGRGITTLYAHLSAFARDARYGSRVRQGETVAYVGATGLATAPHLHYEYRRNGVPLNPRTVDLPRAEPLKGTQLTAFLNSAKPLIHRLESRRALLAANQYTP